MPLSDTRRAFLLGFVLGLEMGFERETINAVLSLNAGGHNSIYLPGRSPNMGLDSDIGAGWVKGETL
ncbi:MAG: hypothetical protein AAFU56_11395 [Pseudomonadota bacterium]